MRLFILISLTLILFVGCSNDTSESREGKDQINVEQTSFQDEQTLTNQEIASHLATIASEVPDVHDAAAVVAGPYAVVGIDIDAETEREQVGTIKYAVNEALQHDPYGRTAIVIADADMMTRIRQMGTQLQEGQPVKGIVDELANIVSRYMPTLPAEDTNNNNSNNHQEDQQDPNNPK